MYSIYAAEKRQLINYGFFAGLEFASRVMSIVPRTLRRCYMGITTPLSFVMAAAGTLTCCGHLFFKEISYLKKLTFNHVPPFYAFLFVTNAIRKDHKYENNILGGAVYRAS